MRHINAVKRIALNNSLRTIFILALSLLLPAGFLSAAVLSTDPVTQLPAAASSAPSSETKAKIVSLEGTVKILKKNAETWQAAQENQPIDEGDQILTGQNSSADIAYDNYLLNISHLKENTKAEIRSIDPTDIYLEDGSIFSALDGLSGKGGYQIATPTAVAAVRGTHFDVGYDQSSKKFTAASLPTGDKNHISKIFVTDPKVPQSAGVEVVENKQLDLKFGEPIQKSMIKQADPARLQAGKEVFHQMEQRMPKFQELRGEGKAHLQEMKQRGPGQRQNLNQDSSLEKKPQDYKDRREPGEMNVPVNQGNTEIREPVNSLENVQALDDLLDSEKPQQVKPFGSFKPKPQSLYGSNQNSQAPGSEGEPNGNNPENGQGQGPMVMKPFGQMRPQSINEKPALGNQNQGPMNGPGRFQQQPSGQQNNNQQQPQGKRQGPPPQGPPSKR